MNVIALNTQAQSQPIAQPKGRKVSPEKALKAVKTKALKAKPQQPKDDERSVLTQELSALTGAPVSPLMSTELIKAKIEEAKQPVVVEPEPKAKVIPSKAQGIGAFCVVQLKAGTKPKDVLTQALEKFPSAKTSMACVYWYASKIKAGLL